MIGAIIFFTLSLLFLFATGIRIVRPTHKLVIETLGKYTRTSGEGFTWLVPIIQTGHYVNVTEQMIDTREQTVITKDNLNAMVDAVIYYKINNVENSLYNVADHKLQLGSLTRTTLRNVVGNMTFSDANSQRDQINQSVEQVLSKETASYGLDILRVELQKVEAPEDIQEAMNEVVKAERNKLAAKDFANAEVIKAEGNKRANIEEAEGNKQAAIKNSEGNKQARINESEGNKQARLNEAEGKAGAIKLENEAAHKYFKGNAQMLKRLEVTENSLSNNSKIVVPTNSDIVNVIGELSGVAPINTGKKK